MPEDGAAGCAAEIVLTRRRFRKRARVDEPVVGVERPAPQRVKGRAAPLVGPGARRDGDLSARRAPRLRVVGQRLKSELLDGIDRDEVIHAAEGGERRETSAGGLARRGAGADAEVGRDAVHREVVRVGALAVHGELALLVEARPRDDRAGRETDERLKISAVGRVALDKLLVEGRRDRGG